MADVLSPWQQTGIAAQQLGNSLNNITVGLAQQRFARQMAIQHMLMQQQQMAQQQQLNQAHANLYGEQAATERAQAERLKAAALLDQATVDAANIAGDSGQVFMKTMVPSIRPPEMQGVEGPLTPTQDLQATALADALARTVGQGMRSAALKGHPQYGIEAAQQARALSGTPMTPGLAQAMLLKAKPMSVGAGNAVWNPATGRFEGVNPDTSPPGMGLNIAALQALRALADKPMGLESAMDPEGPLGPDWVNRVRELSTNVAPAAVSAPLTSVPRAILPTPGEIRKGYRFKGGSPSDPNSWEKVQ